MDLWKIANYTLNSVFLTLDIFRCYTQPLQKSTEKMEKEKRGNHW